MLDEPAQQGRPAAPLAFSVGGGYGLAAGLKDHSADRQPLLSGQVEEQCASC